MTTTERIKACLKNNIMTDVALVGDDGIPIAAIRCVLGSASPVLKEMLYTSTIATPTSSSDTIHNGGVLTSKDEDGLVLMLQPQKSLMIRIPGFRRRTIKALVEYCCSDSNLMQTSFFKSIFPHKNTTTTTTKTTASSFRIPINPAKAVTDLLDFANIAIKYEIPKVPQQVVDDFVIPLTKQVPPMACIVMNYLLTVEFPDSPNEKRQQHQHRHEQQQQRNASSTHVDMTVPFDCQDNPPTPPSFQRSSRRTCKEKKDAEKVVSAAAALTKLYTTAVHIIRTQPYLALEPYDTRATIVPPPASTGGSHVPATISSNSSSTGTILWSLAGSENHSVQHPSSSGVTKSAGEGGTVGGVLALHAKTFAKILQDTEVEADELFLFRQLLRWHEYHSDKLRSLSAAPTRQMNQQHDSKREDRSQKHKIAVTSMTGINHADSDDEDSLLCRSNLDDLLLSSADSSSNEDTEDPCKVLQSTGSAASLARDDSKSMPKTPGSTQDGCTMHPLKSDDDNHGYLCPDPTSVCRKLVQHIDLAAIDPHPLKEFVSGAEFVDAKFVMDALWQQVFLANDQGGLSFASVVRGTGGPRASLPEGLHEVTNNTPKKVSHPHHQKVRSSQHQSFSSHILVHGAGVEECNGIYTQVTTQQITSKEEGGSLATCGVWDNMPTLMTISSDTTDSSDRQHWASPHTTPCPTAANVATCICLRFVKQSKRKQQNKGNKWYLVCRRELLEESARLSPLTFHHQWSIIEEDNRDGGQLRVLYEWEQGNGAKDQFMGPPKIQGGPPTISSAPIVLDSSTLQKFPETGWTCVRDRYFPTPTLKWFRPRHGCPLLVVPQEILLERPIHKTIAKAPCVAAMTNGVPMPQPPPPPRYPKALSGLPMLKPSESLYGLGVSMPPPPPPPRYPKALSGLPMLEPSESLYGLSILSSSCPTPKNHRVKITIRDEKLDTHNDGRKSLNCTDEIECQTSNTTASSSFQVHKARDRVSLADASMETSALDDQC
jgi:hypothetical protein